jgi:uncharacterized protein (TIGR03086 family)
MADAIALFLRAVDQTRHVVDGIRDDQLGLATPCREWDVRTLLNHTLASVLMFDAAARGEAFDLSTYQRDLIDGDPSGAYKRAGDRLREALAVPGVAERSWRMPGGDSPPQDAVRIGIIEMQQHGWDLARATGQQVEFDAEVTGAAAEAAREMTARYGRGAGVFGDEVEPPADAPAHDRLAAFLGRAV